MALHRPEGVRSRDVLRERRDRGRRRARTTRARGGRRRPRLGERPRDRPCAGRYPLRAARGSSPSRRTGRLRREVRRAQRRRVGARSTRARPEGRRARAAADDPNRQLGRRRLALLAAADRRRPGQPLLGDRGVRIDDARALRLPERRGRDLRRRRRQGRVRLRAERLAGDLALRNAPRARRARCRAGLGRCRLRLQEGQDPDPERPRRPGRHLARHRRLLRRRRSSIWTTTPSRSTSRPTRRATSRSRARSATSRAPSGAG